MIAPDSSFHIFSFFIVYIESDVIFAVIPSWVQIQLRLYTKLTFSHQLVISHEDIWSCQHLVDQVGGCIYRFFRTVNGYFSTLMLHQFDRFIKKE